MYAGVAHYQDVFWPLANITIVGVLCIGGLLMLAASELHEVNFVKLLFVVTGVVMLAGGAFYGAAVDEGANDHEARKQEQQQMDEQHAEIFRLQCELDNTEKPPSEQELCE